MHNPLTSKSSKTATAALTEGDTCTGADSDTPRTASDKERTKPSRSARAQLACHCPRWLWFNTRRVGAAHADASACLGALGAGARRGRGGGGSIGLFATVALTARLAP